MVVVGNHESSGAAISFSTDAGTVKFTYLTICRALLTKKVA